MTLPVPLRIGRNVKSLEYRSDPTERATAVAAKCAQLAGKPTFLGGARFVVATADSGTSTVVLESPNGGAGPVAFDDQLVGWYLVSDKTALSALISDSAKTSATQSTLTLATWPTGLAAGDVIRFTMNEPGTGLQGSGAGLQPWYLEHPIYAGPTWPGIGRKFRTIDRSDKVAVANLCPNAVMRTWTDPTKMPDGWTFDFQFGPHAENNPTPIALGGFIDIAQNTDPLYTRYGGQSLGFTIVSGSIVSPPIPLAPVYAGQSLSIRASLLLTTWASLTSAGITMRLALRNASDGTLVPWYDSARSLQAQTPLGVLNDKDVPRLSGGTWVDLVLNANDITMPSAYAANLRPNADDISNMADGTTFDGLVVVIDFVSNSTTHIQGFLDAISVTQSLEAPSEISEFGEAIEVWQDVDTALRLLAKPQFTLSAEVLDLKRMNPALDEEALDAGALIMVNDGDLGIVDDVERITDVRINDLVPGDTSITIAPRNRRLTQRLLAGSKKQQQQISAVTGASKPVSSGGSSGSGGPALVLNYTITSYVPTVTALVSSNVVKVKFAVSTSAYPDLATTQAATADTATPFEYVGSAMAPGDTLYVSALAYDNNGVESALARVLITVAAPLGLFWYSADRVVDTDTSTSDASLYGWDTAGDTTITRVVRVPDATGNGNTLERDSSGSGPKLVTAASCANGHNTVRSPGGGNYAFLKTGSGVGSGALSAAALTEFTLIFIARMVYGGGYVLEWDFFQSGRTNPLSIGIGPFSASLRQIGGIVDNVDSGTTENWPVASSGGTYVDEQVAIVAVRWDGTDVTFSKNGVTLAGSFPLASPLTVDAFRVRNANFEWAVIGAGATCLSDADLDPIIAALSASYGIT